jgi:hypothetical protein
MLLAIEKTKKCLFPARGPGRLGTAFTATHTLRWVCCVALIVPVGIYYWICLGVRSRAITTAVVADADVCVCVLFVCVAGSASAIEKINLQPQRQPTFKLLTKIPEFTFARSIDNMVNNQKASRALLYI